MTDEGKARGLLDEALVELTGESREPRDPSPDFVPGMGLGATRQATRWAWLGMQQEVREGVKRALKRPAHRPRKDPIETKDSIRAFAAWQMCRNLRHNILKKPNAQFRACLRRLLTAA